MFSNELVIWLTGVAQTYQVLEDELNLLEPLDQVWVEIEPRFLESLLLDVSDLVLYRVYTGVSGM